MDVFKLRDQVIEDYSKYVRSFLRIRDERIREYVEQHLDEGMLWPDPLVQLNPSYAFGPSIDDLVGAGKLHPLCQQIFRIKREDGTSKGMRVYVHQEQAIDAALEGDSYVLTTGTGSGKSLAYIIPIVNHVLRRGSGKGIQALIVYPMNALANSQVNELEKYLKLGFDKAPVTFARYTGQEGDAERNDILANPPDILLTNYVMLELILTRVRERSLIQSMEGLQFLVLDELHTYRGRQGADVALLVRRVKDYANVPHLQCVGTSATLADSEGDSDPRQGVAKVASQIFGTTVKPERVIQETLRRHTAPTSAGDEQRAALHERLCSAHAASSNYEAFLRDPLTEWVESTFGVRDDSDGRLVRARPLPVTGPSGAAARLAALTGVDQETCVHAIQEHLLMGNQVIDPETDLPVLAFRVNQFISRGDTAYASLDGSDTRVITTEAQRFVPGDRTRALLPLVFCRECGQEFYVVARRAAEDGAVYRYSARDPQSYLPEDADEEYGYLYPQPEAGWLKDDLDPDLLPDEWLEQGRDRSRVKSSQRKRVPKLVYVNTLGIEDPNGLPFLYIGKRLDFCPACGVTYDARQRSDYAKLGSLDAGGRSSATTTLGLSVMEGLDTQNTPRQARKLLSFTDNRQDAALQAGHLNDFVEIGLLRAAVYAAAKSAGAAGLRYEYLPGAVFKALDLPLEGYANNPGVKYLALEETKSALRSVLGYRVYHDLRRGWRVNAPNLEQCGLLEIEYASLDELCADEDPWRHCHPALAGASVATRRAVAKTLLDHLRRSLVIDEPSLRVEQQEVIRRQSQGHLIGPWSIDESERMESSGVAYARSRREGDSGGNLFLSSRSGFGQYLRRETVFPEFGQQVPTGDIEPIIRQLLAALNMAGLVIAVDEQDPECPGYQACVASFIWRAGDGTKAFRDPIRVPRASSEGAYPNPFFIDVYTRRARNYMDVTAAEHTAQVRAEVRQDRERRFRSGELPILYCSPTMELGIDIAQLNVVNMRNVPPSPANYAQRSGRAGRSGQPALVYTYCTRGSPHDQYYFRHASDMVSGAVAPPRLDLANEDLVRAHLDAVWLTETGASLYSSLTELLDVAGDSPSLKLTESVRHSLASRSAKERAAVRFSRILQTLEGELASSDWYDKGWLWRNLENVEHRFDAACDRWRSLYRSALSQAQVQGRITLDASRSKEDRDKAERLRREAVQQQNILMSDSGGSTLQSDFYSYRYFASEGFLPGYSFPRLPLSAYIPARRGPNDNEFLSRPRFLAISEFGPRNIIYHEGSRYVVNRVMLPVEESVEATLTTRAKVCPVCGYLHPISSGDGPDICEYCGAALGAPLSGMLRMQNVSTRRRDRINSDEEERLRMGYDLFSAIRFGQREGETLEQRADVFDQDDRQLLSFSYGHAATIWRVNRGWRRRTPDSPLGFMLDVERGYWQRNADDDDDLEDPMSPRRERVIPFVEDRRNCLLIRFPEPQPIQVMATLQTALKHGIQVLYQLEDSELAAEPLPSERDRRVIVLYEAAEGGAGVLRQLVTDPRALGRVARAALEVCHFDPDTGENVSRRQGQECEAACYDCLMSYYNQRDHELLDRHLIRDLLMQLKEARVGVSPGAASREDTLQRLLAICESDLERQWLRHVDAKQLRLPDEAQKEIEGCFVRPDFYYREAQVAVFVDGPDHQWQDQKQRDREAEDRLLSAGITSIRFPLPDSGWDAILQEHAYLFGSNE